MEKNYFIILIKFSLVIGNQNNSIENNVSAYNRA